MTTRTASKILALKISATLSIALFSLIVVGMHTVTPPARLSIELPTVVVVGHKSDLPNATAQVKAALPNNS